MGESGTLYARTADLPLLQGKLPAGVALAADDTITLGGVPLMLLPTTVAEKEHQAARRRAERPAAIWPSFLWLTRLDAQHDWFLQNAGLEITI